MINEKELSKEVIILNESIIGSTPMLMKKLILRGYRVLAVSPLCGKIEIECFKDKTLLDTQEKAMQKGELRSERGFN